MASQRYISDTLKQKKLLLKKVRMTIYLLILGGLVYGAVRLLAIEEIQITEVSITGNSFVTTEQVEQKTNAILNSHFAYVIPKSNIFLFPSRELASKIKENPAVINVEVKKTYFQTITIHITEQEKEALYCKSPDRLECFYLNGEGYIYSPLQINPIFENEIVLYRESDPKNIREFVVDTELYRDIMAFVKSSARYGIFMGSIHIKSDGVIEFITNSGVRVLTSQYDDFEKDFSNFMALFEKNILDKNNLSQIEYIDVRFGNKVFYKNKTTDILEE